MRWLTRFWAVPTGVEPATSGLTTRRSDLLSYDTKALTPPPEQCGGVSVAARSRTGISPREGGGTSPPSAVLGNSRSGSGLTRPGPIPSLFQVQPAVPR